MNHFRLSRLLARLIAVSMALVFVAALVPVLPRVQAQGGVLAYGDVVTGQITAKTYYESWEFQGQKGDRVQVVMEGDGNLDPYLGLIELATETVLVEDDDSGGGGNAFIDLTLPSSGSFMIIATRYNFDVGTTAGQYTLGLTGSGGPTAVANPTSGGEPVEIEPGVYLMGALTLDQPVAGMIDELAYAQIYELEVQAGTDLVVAMLADGGTLDSYLFFADEEFNLLAEDDDSAAEFGGGMLDAYLSLTVPETGLYYVVGTRAGMETGTSTGAYTLVAGVMEPEAAPVAQQEAADDLPVGVDFIAEVTVGASQSGAITENSFMHLYTFEGQAGEEITITMMGSGGLDAYLGLLDPVGEIVAEDDDSLGGLDAVITARLPESGSYMIAATRSGIDEGTTTGSYTLEFSSGEPEAQPEATGLSSFGGLPGRAITVTDSTFYLRGNGASGNPEKSPPIESFFRIDTGLPGTTSPLLPVIQGIAPQGLADAIPINLP